MLRLDPSLLVLDGDSTWRVFRAMGLLTSPREYVRFGFARNPPSRLQGVASRAVGAIKPWLKDLCPDPSLTWHSVTLRMSGPRRALTVDRVLRTIRPANVLDNVTVIVQHIVVLQCLLDGRLWPKVSRSMNADYGEV